MKKKKALFLDASYTIRKGATYVTLILKSKKTFRLYYPYDPYFYVECPLNKKSLIEKVAAKR
ncbi:hypothetical protein JXB01_04745, partial [Candidatus Micrarchaeota archaeon]|nr:hypothetical protein [Candidatus Micrarchaeota archaeon]